MTTLLDNPESVFLLCFMAGLLCLSGFFSSSETALFFLSREEIEAFRRGTRVAERRVVYLLHEPDRVLTAVLFWNLLINLAFFACGVVISTRLIKAGHATLAGGFSVLSLALMILLGEVLPKSVAVLFRQTLARAVSLPLAVSIRLLDPFVPVFRQTTRALRRMFWPEIQKEQYIEPQDLEQAIDNSAGGKHVLGQERVVLHNILDLSEITVEEVMRPRGTYTAMRPPIHLADIRNALPVSEYLAVLATARCGRHQDNEVTGVVPLAEMIHLPAEHLEEMAEPVVHVPWCATVALVLSRLKSTQRTVAVVVNEFGETIGIVTWEDVVDTILAAEPSRAKRVLRRDPIVELQAGQWKVDGITSLRYLSRKLKLDYDGNLEAQVTVAGLFYERLERLPEPGDQCVWKSLTLTVSEVPRPGWFTVVVTKPGV